MDVNINATANLDPVAKEGANVIASGNKGVGKICYALFGPWIENRTRQAELIAAQTEVECQAIREHKASYYDGVLIPYHDPGTLQGAYQAIHQLNHETDALRLKAAVNVAANKLYSIADDQISDEPISPTFFNHWRREAELIDEEDLREQWASLLVEETKSPGSISPRTLEVVAGLTREDAEIFQRASRGVFDGMILVRENNSDGMYCSYDDFLKLADARLISLNITNVTELADSTDGYVKHIYYREKLMMQTHAPKVISSGFSLTRAGKDLLRILNPMLSSENVISLAKRVAAMNPDYVMSVNEITDVKDGHVFYKQKPLWSTTSSGV